MVEQRFISLADLAQILGISAVQARALVTSGDIPAIQIGGRGQWRIDKDVLEEYIAQGYQQTREHVSQRQRS